MSFSEEKAESHLATPTSPTIIKQKHPHTQSNEKEGHAGLHPKSCLRVCLSMYKHSLFVSCLETPPHPYDVTLLAFIGL